MNFQQKNITLDNSNTKRVYRILFLCFCVVYKVPSVYCTISLPEESSVNEEDFDIKSRLTQSKQFLKL